MCGNEPSARLKQEARSGNGRRVLLIGGSGYVGGPLTNALLEAGYYVRNFDFHLYGNGGAVLCHLLHPRYEVVSGDLTDTEQIGAALREVTDVVILAGLVGDPVTKKYPRESRLINEIGIQSCIDALNTRGLGKVVFVSTCSNYGLLGGDKPVSESHELKPLSLYAAAKVMAEHYLLSQRGLVDYCPVILRFATAFGLAPRMRFDLTVNEFTRELLQRRELLVFDAKTWRPYCHVKDFARLICRVLDAPPGEVSFEVFNAGSDANNHTKQEIVDLICKRIPDCWITYRDHGSDPRNYRVSFEKVRTRLDFEPAYDVVDGIEEIMRALKSGLLDDVDARQNYYGNYEISYSRAGLPA